MKFVEEDTYLCPICGCMFKREELGKDAPDFSNAIIERDNVHCMACRSLGMNYQAKNMAHVMFRTTRQ